MVQLQHRYQEYLKFVIVLSLCGVPLLYQSIHTVTSSDERASIIRTKQDFRRKINHPTRQARFQNVTSSDERASIIRTKKVSRRKQSRPTRQKKIQKIVPSSCTPAENYPGMFLHYHKTGNNIGYKLMRSISENEPKALLVVRNHFFRNENVVRNHFFRNEKANNVKNSIFPPIMPFDDNYSKLLIQRPGILCTKNNTYLSTLPPATKIIHSVRDPVDMALSNYLYHSQKPTPEPWVYNHKPCLVGDRKIMLQLAAETIGINYNTEIEPAIALCHNIFYTENQANYTFYHLLRSLPTYKGLQLATLMLLLASKDAGRCLMDMANNAIRLREWNNTGHIHLLVVEMQQWIHNPFNISLQAVDFMIDDCHLNQEQKRNVASKMLNDSIAKINSNSNHITQGKMDTEERDALKQQLLEDPILGSILRKLTSAMRENI